LTLISARNEENTMKRKGSARWQGTAKEGQGTVSVESGTLRDIPYSFKARFGDGKGTNPEELIAAAHAGCFTMALSFALNNAGFTADAIDTEAIVSLEQQPSGGFAIPAVHLVTRAHVPGIDAAKFTEIANGAKANCPVSKVLNATITMDASLSA
jgi:osmotically inducible protein OsmC